MTVEYSSVGNKGREWGDKYHASIFCQELNQGPMGNAFVQLCQYFSFGLDLGVTSKHFWVLSVAKGSCIYSALIELFFHPPLLGVGGSIPSCT